MKNWIKYIVLLVVGLFTAYSCVDLSVENLNEPDLKRAIATPTDVIGLASGCYRSFYNQTQEYSGLGLAMVTMADAGTCSWGNCGMRDLSSEPRIEKCIWNNEITYANSATTIYMWGNMYSALSSANDVLKAIAGGMTFESVGVSTKMIQAWCTFIQGITHGYLGLSFNQANIIDETANLGSLVLSPYKDVCMAGIAYLQETLDILATAGNFTLPDGFVLGSNYTKDEFEQLVRGYLARLMIWWPRNGTEAQQIDWADVLSVLTSGAGALSYDHAPYNDGGATWYDALKDYGTYPGWARVDHRIINLMSPTYPSRWPMDNVWPSGDPGRATSVDARLHMDFAYLTGNDFNPTRGYYHFSHYRYNRYAAWQGSLNYFDYMPTMRAWEVQMMIAEAKLKTGDKAGAITILNSETDSLTGARKVRGGLTDISGSATDTQVWDAIMYEKEVECFLTGMGTSFFDMRRNDMLQYGTINHWPLPKTEIELIGLPFYTIGTNPPDGYDRALYGWVGLDGQKSPYPDGWPGYPDKPPITKK